MLKHLGLASVFFFVVFYLQTCQIKPAEPKRDSTYAQEDEPRQQSAPTDERVIWQGKTGRFLVIWTTKDIYAGSGPSAETTSGLVRPSFVTIHEINTKSAEKFLRNAGSAEVFWKVVDVGSYSLLSVVGSLITLEVYSSSWVEGASASTSGQVFWLTIDLAKEPIADFLFDRDSNLNSQYSRKISLTEIYSKKTIIKALLANDAVRTQIGGKPKHEQARILESVFDATAINVLRVGKNAEFSLSRLDGFAFDRIQGGKVAVQIQVQQIAGVTREVEYIEILLPITGKLIAHLHNANLMRSGFLKRDLKAVSRDQLGEFKLETTLKNPNEFK